MGDVFEMLAGTVRKDFRYSAPPRETPARPGGQPDDPITAAALYPRYRDFLKPSDQVVIESGSSTSGIVPLFLPDGAEVHSQTLWGSMGWATGATLGVGMADPSRRTVLFTGEGSPDDRRRCRDHGPSWAEAESSSSSTSGLPGRAGAGATDWVYNDLAPGTITPCPPPWAAGAGSRRESPRSASSTPRWPWPPGHIGELHRVPSGAGWTFPVGLADGPSAARRHVRE